MVLRKSIVSVMVIEGENEETFMIEVEGVILAKDKLIIGKSPELCMFEMTGPQTIRSVPFFKALLWEEVLPFRFRTMPFGEALAFRVVGLTYVTNDHSGRTTTKYATASNDNQDMYQTLFTVKR